jgi:hypothetical protein
MTLIDDIATAFHLVCSTSYENSKLALEKYEKWHLVLLSVAVTYFCVRLYDYYTEIDTGDYFIPQICQKNINLINSVIFCKKDCLNSLKDALSIFPKSFPLSVQN